MHFETAEKYNDACIATFEALRESFGDMFAIEKGPESRSLAGDIVELLGWMNHKKYEEDMKTLLPDVPLAKTADPATKEEIGLLNSHRDPPDRAPRLQSS